MGQSLTLQCEVTTVRGITSRVDIVWSSDGTELGSTDGVTATMGNPLIYTDSYDIMLLSTTDDGAVYECEAVINSSPSTTAATNNITLDVIGEDLIAKWIILLSSHHHTWLVTGYTVVHVALAIGLYII